MSLWSWLTAPARVVTAAVDVVVEAPLAVADYVVDNIWYTPPPLPSMRAPVLQPPPAPQTGPKMKTWNTQDVAEATAQQQQQFNRDAAAIRYDATIAPFNQAPAAPKPPDDSLSWWTWLGLGLAGVGTVLLVQRGRR
ncbi:MAG: hypothetical protein LAQ30_01630 [Acidobacteriia bacterium]|nr:hypothetical protein [Terriglobia bacterium]